MATVVCMYWNECSLATAQAVVGAAELFIEIYSKFLQLRSQCWLQGNRTRGIGRQTGTTNTAGNTTEHLCMSQKARLVRKHWQYVAL